MAHWKKRGIFMVENQVFGRADGGSDLYNGESDYAYTDFNPRSHGGSDSTSVFGIEVD